MNKQQKAKVADPAKRKAQAVARKFVVETFGCQMNAHDSERIAGLLVDAGLTPSATDTDADVVVLNTCSVREKAEDKLYSRVGAIRTAATDAKRTPPTIVIAGCVAQQEGQTLLKGTTAADVVVGTQSLKQLPELLERSLETKRRTIDINPYEDVSFPIGAIRHADPVRAMVTIIEGCNDYCSFCVVPYTRGHERMRPAADILAEVEHGVTTGHPEIQLLGQIVNHYQAPDDPSIDFGGLLRRVAAVPGVRRVRFASPHPRHVTAPMIAALRDEPTLCKHLHIPVQSGSTRVLGAMRRRYTREDYLALVTDLRRAVPSIALSTDIIVGFPGETDAEFEETYSLVEAVRYHAIYSFKYSPRPNTLAEKRLPDDVPEAEKTRRIVRLQQLQREIQAEIYRGMVGTLETVLVDSVSRRREADLSGRTSGNVVVNFAGDPGWIGREVTVRISEAAPNSIRGEVINVHDTQMEGAAC